MKKTILILTLSASFLLIQPALGAVSDEEIQALRDQVELLTERLDQLEGQNQQAARASVQTSEETVAKVEEIDKKLEAVGEKMTAMSWAERISWKGDFRYRYENIDQENKDGRNRNRIRARMNLGANITPTVKVGVGLATGGNDPVSTNQTIGGGGATKGMQLDLAYFDWSGLENTRVIGGKFSNFLVRPAKKGLIWDGDWRPEGLGGIWDNGTFFVQGLGTWLEGDSKKGTEFAWVLQAGKNFKLGQSGSLKLGAGYSDFNIAGRTPLFGDPDDFFGNSFVTDPVTGALVFANDYRNFELFAESKFTLGGNSLALFADYTVNNDADENDTGYLLGAKYGSAKKQGTWDITYFYEKIEADAVVGLLTDSDFGGGGTDNKGHVVSGSYVLDTNWTFKATYFNNDVDISTGNPKDFERLMLDLSFKFK